MPYKFNALTGNFDVAGATDISGLANTSLSNLASVAINTSLISDTDNTDALGSSAIGWTSLFLSDAGGAPTTNGQISYNTANSRFEFYQNGGVVFIGSGDITSVGDVAGGAAFDGTQGTTLTFFNAGGNSTLSYNGTTLTSSVFITANLTGDVTGNADTATTATNATNITAADETTDTTCFPIFVTAATGNLGPKTAASLAFNSNTGVLTSTFSGNITGNVTGNADTATTATNATNVTVADETTDTTCFVTFVTAATGNLPPKSAASLAFNSNTGVLSSTFSGNLTGNVTGNADTATNVEGTGVLSTGEVGATKFLREDGDGTCSWQTVSAGASTLQEAFDGGQTIVIADTDNQTLALTNNDTTNNPLTMSITNAGSDEALYINQSGVLAANQRALYVYSNAANVNSGSYLLMVHQDSASATRAAAYFLNDGPGGAAYFYNAAALSGTNAVVDIRATANQTVSTSRVLYIENTSASSNNECVDILNNGTGNGIYITQAGVLATNSYAFTINSTGAQTNASYLMTIIQNSASSTADCIYIDNDGTGNIMYMQQDGVLQNAHYMLHIYTNIAQTNTSNLLFVESDNASSTATVATIQNDGTGAALSIDQNGAGKALAIVQSGAAVALDISNTSTSYTFNAIASGVVSGTNVDCFRFANTATQTTGTGYIFEIENIGAGTTSDTVHIENDGTGHALIIDQDGTLASAHYGLVVSGSSQSNTDAMMYSSVGASSAGCACLRLNHASDGAHIYFTGDPSVASPTDGEMWFDGTNLKMRIGSTTYNIDMTAV